MAFRKNSQHILVLRERKTMFTLSVPLSSKRASDTSQAMIRLPEKIPPEARKTLTLDNSGEFAHHQILADALGLTSFFCDPYASWQRAVSKIPTEGSDATSLEIPTSLP